MLRLDRLLAGAEGRGDSVLEHVAVEQRLGELADRLLAASPQAVLIVVSALIAPDRCLIDISLTGASGSPEILLRMQAWRSID